MTYEETPKEAKLHEGSASSVRPHVRVSKAFTWRYPKRGVGYGCSPTIHAGNLSSRPLWGKTEISIPHSPAGFKREMPFLEIAQGYFERCSRLYAAKMAALHAVATSCDPPGIFWKGEGLASFQEGHATGDVRERHHDFSTCDRRMSHVGSARLSSLVSRLRAHAKLSMWRTRARQSPRQDIRPKSQNFRMAAGADHAIRAKDSLQSPAQQASCQTDRYGARAEQTPFEHDQN